jgi:hypothetical protein
MGEADAMMHPYHAKLARLLDRMGGLYTVQDILGAIAAGRMQSFVEGETWAITQIACFPRARVLEILVVVGALDDCRKLLDRIFQFADANDIGLVQAYGRRGWLGHPLTSGWKIRTKSFLYQREL